MVDFIFKRNIFRIREMAFAKSTDIVKKNCDVIYLHSSDNDLNNTPAKSHSKLQYTLINNLLLTEEELLGKVKKNCKYEIRRAEKEGVITCVYLDKHKIDTSGVIGKFKKVYNEMFRAKNLEYYFNEDLFLAGIEAKQLIVTTNALNNNLDCVVYHAYLVDGDSAVLMYSASPLWEDGDKEKANAIGRLNKHLHWKDMLWFKENGYSRYEWGGISNPNEPNGIDRFKSEFGGDVVCYANYIIPCSLRGKIYVSLVKRRRK